MRIITFLILFYLALHLPVLYVAPLVWWYILRWSGLELLIGAFLIDAYFGVGSVVPLYTICTMMAIIVMEWVRPRISFYNT